jgi:hypothetical protein
MVGWAKFVGWARLVGWGRVGQNLRTYFTGQRSDSVLALSR